MKKKKSILRFLAIIPLLILLLILAAVIMVKRDAMVPYQVSTEGLFMPKFNQVDIGFTHRYNKAISIQTTAGAIINLDNAGAEEVFIGGGRDQKDGMFRFEDGKFIDITEQSGLTKTTEEATLGAISLDVDKDGDDDLLVTRSTSVWLYTNSGGKLSGAKMDITMDDETSPLSIGVGDVNKDGHFDMYICGYLQKDKIEGLNIFNKEGYGGNSRLFVNNGDNTFTDATVASGLEYKHNTFQSVFSDIDNDGDADLVVAHDTGQVRTYRNTGDGKFEMVKNPNTDLNSYPMGIAMDDYNNDGKTDFFFSNTGTTTPAFLASGDLRDDQVYHSKWIMFRNDGDFKFTDTAETTKLADYEFSWGAAFEDFNLDGLPDLVVSENFVDLPTHKVPFLRLPCRFLLQNSAGEFAEAGDNCGVINKFFSIAPLTADLNLDGAPDLIHINMAGPSKAFISEAPENNFVKVQLPNNSDSVGAVVTATLSDGKTIIRPFVKGEGLCSDSSPIITLGLGKANIDTLKVAFLNGKTVDSNECEVGATVVIE